MSQHRDSLHILQEHWHPLPIKCVQNWGLKKKTIDDLSTWHISFAKMIRPLKAEYWIFKLNNIPKLWEFHPSK